MPTRTLLATVLVGAFSVSGVMAQAAPPPPKGFTKSVAYTDATPDPTGNTGATNADHCTGRLPQEAGITVKVPGPGDLDISIAGFTGDWALQIKDTKGNVLTGDDVNPPDFEATSVRLKKAATIIILPCNLAGTPNGKVTYKYSFRK